MFFIVVMIAVSLFCSIITLGQAIKTVAKRFDKVFYSCISIAYIVLSFIIYMVGVK